METGRQGEALAKGREGGIDRTWHVRLLGWGVADAEEARRGGGGEREVGRTSMAPLAEREGYCAGAVFGCSQTMRRRWSVRGRMARGSLDNERRTKNPEQRTSREANVRAAFARGLSAGMQSRPPSFVTGEYGTLKREQRTKNNERRTADRSVRAPLPVSSSPSLKVSKSRRLTVSRQRRSLFDSSPCPRACRRASTNARGSWSG